MILYIRKTSHPLKYINKMKHINMDEVIKRRRESKLEERNAPQMMSDFHRCVNKKFREVNDQTIEQMIRIAKRK